MSEAGTPASQPAGPQPVPEEEKASGPLRLLAVLAALALLFGALVMVFVVINPDDIPLCDDVRSGEAALGPTRECFDTSETQYVLSKVFAAPAAVLATLAGLLGFYVAATGRRGGLMVRLAVVAVALGILAYLVELF